MKDFLSSLKVRLALFFGLAIGVVGVPTYLYIDQVYTRQLREDRLQALQGQAVAVAAVLSENLRERQREIALLAETPYLKRGVIAAAEFQPVLDWLQASYPLYAWIGYAEVSGQVAVSTNGLLVNADVSRRPWFSEGQKGQYVGDVHEALMLSKRLPQPADGSVIRFIDFAAPVIDVNGRVRGVLAAHAHWTWAEEVSGILRNKHLAGNGVEILIVNQAGTVIYPEKPGLSVAPAVLAGRPASDNGNGMSAYAHAVAAVAEPIAGSALGWRVVARRPLDSLFADVDRLKQTLVVGVLAATLAMMLLIAWLATRLSRPVEQLSQLARRIEAGDETVAIVNDVRTLEIRQTIEAVQKIAGVLIARRQALADANRDLEHKVAERTAELLEQKNLLEERVLERTRELAAARDKAEAGNRAKTHILANMSHELRTPLNHIVGLNTLLRREVTAPRVLDRVDKIGQAGQSLLRLITHLRDTVQAETAQLDIMAVDFDRAALIEKVDASCRAAAAEKGLAVHWTVADDVPERLHGDEQRLAQVLSELLDNAIKFSTASPIAVRISAGPPAGGSLPLHCAIEDQGIGMPPDIQAQMFELFAQGDPSATRKYGGLGLGLPLCQRLVHLMAGAIGFTSSPGQGSTFWISVPLRVGAPRPPGQAGDRAQSWSGAGPELAALLVQLAEGDFAAGATWAALAPRVVHLLGPQGAAFASALADYEFDAALAILRAAGAEG